METLHLEAWHWLILGGVLIVAELFTTSFFSLFLGISALIIAVTSWLVPVPWLFQVIVWLVVSLILTALWFLLIYPHMKSKTMQIGSDAIIGQTGMIILPLNTACQSKVRFSVPMFGANEWACRVLENHSVQVGERVKVIDVIGNELLVSPMNAKYFNNNS